MKIDIHTHFIPPQFIEDVQRGRALNNIRLEKRGQEDWFIHPQGYRYPVAPEFFNMEAKLRHMDSLGLDMSVLSISPTLFFYWAEAAPTCEFCQMANESLSKYVSQSGGRLRGMATVPLQDPDAAAVELRRAITQLGLTGVEIGTVMENVPLDDPRFDQFFTTAEELNAPVLLHPYYVGPKPMLGDFYMTNLIGNPLDTTIASARMIMSGFLERHPNLKVILVHAGGFMPYQIGRLDHGYAVRSESNAHIKRPPSTYLSRFYFDTITHADKPLRFLIDLAGKENVLIGTDIPFDMADTHFAERLEFANLDRETAQAIQSENAKRLFRL